jgi:hypothetical protein
MPIRLPPTPSCSSRAGRARAREAEQGRGERKNTWVSRAGMAHFGQLSPSSLGCARQSGRTRVARRGRRNGAPALGRQPDRQGLNYIALLLLSPICHALEDSYSNFAILNGEARITIDSRKETLTAGDSSFIPLSYKAPRTITTSAKHVSPTGRSRPPTNRKAHLSWPLSFGLSHFVDGCYEFRLFDGFDQMRVTPSGDALVPVFLESVSRQSNNWGPLQSLSRFPSPP